MTEKYLKISQLARLLNDTLEMYVGESFFEGELQELTRASSGHLYCTIKDEISSLSIVLWATSAKQLKFKPEKGVLVRCQGRPNVYSKTGRLQIVVSRMELAGEGALQQKFEELKKKLSTEGLFAPERKRAIPFLPRAIGLVTSAQGAAVHDIMNRLQERMPHIPVYLVDVRVQGDGAAGEIAAAVKFLSESEKVDVIICGRGGGSLQDLWSFNEEVVVRAIFASKVPVISAVGHEVDISLADLAADLRAPTPTAAAEMVVPKKQELLRILAEISRRLSDFQRWLMPKAQELDDTFSRLGRAVIKNLESLNLRLTIVSGRVQSLNPKTLIELEQAKLAKLMLRMSTVLRFKVEESKRALQGLEAKLDPERRRETLSLQQERLERLESRMLTALQSNFKQSHHAVAKASARLIALNPTSVLSRGYSITRKAGKVVLSSKEVNKGDTLAIQLLEGTIEAKI